MDRRFQYHEVVLLFLLLAVLWVPQAFGQIDEAKQAIERGEFVRAVNILTEALAARPTADAFLYLGIAYGNMKEYQKAEDTLKEGSARFADDARFHTELAGVYLAIHDVARAKSELQRTLSLDPQDRYASDLLASIDLSQGDTETALKFWNKSQQPVIDDILHNYFLTFGSSVVRDAVAFRPAGVLRYEEWKTTQLRLFATNNFSNVGLEVEPTRVRDRYDAILRTSAKMNSLAGFAWNALKGAPIQTTYLDFWNIAGSGTIWTSMYRWDADRHRAAEKLQIPIRIPGLLNLEIANIWRSERWDLTPSIRPQYVDQGRRVAYRANAMGFLLTHIPHYRFEIGGGFEYVNRYAQGDLPQVATDSRNTGKFLLGSVIRFADGVYQNRLQVDGFIARQAIIGNFNYGGGTAELNNRVTLSKPSLLYVDWTIKGGSSRGALPLEDYFFLGLDYRPPNLLRGHTLADHGRYGNGPTGTDFVLGNFDIERRIVILPMFNTLNIPYLIIKGEVFVDAAKIWDRTQVFQNSKLLIDPGVGLKFETPTGTFNLVYARSLRDGNGVLFGYVERRLW